MSNGKVLEVIGAVVDVAFDGELPPIYQALKIEDEGRGINLTLEVASHLGNDVCRTISMSTTDGLVRGMPVRDTGAPISVPVGKDCLGRIFNLLGEPLDEEGPLS
ncbi:MAG: F0F1 ATP synthase subunit beta, partial [Planctomycetota bacterium]|nr:F0F1 ATP synthase subunit beta [Planctomycetota bacterium]